MPLSDVAIMSIAYKATWSAGLIAIFTSMTQWNWTAIIAGIAALGGFFVNWYYRHKKDKRESAESLARISMLKKQNF